MHVSKSDGDNWEKKWQIVNWAEIVILWLRWKTVVALAPLFSKYLLGALAAYKSCRVNVSHRHTIAYLDVEREMKKNQLWCFQQCTGEYLEAAPKRWCFVSIAGIFFKFSFKKTPTQFLWMRGFHRKKNTLAQKVLRNKGNPYRTWNLWISHVYIFARFCVRQVCVCECERIVSLLCSIM